VKEKKRNPSKSENIMTTELLSGDALYQRHYMSPLENGDVPTLFEDFKYLDVSEMMREDHFVVENNGQLIGTLAIQTNPYNDNEIWLKHIVVHKEHRQKGVAKRLLSALFSHAQLTGQVIKRSSPSALGAAYLPGIYAALTNAYPNVRIIAHNAQDF
jgi:GNAT superfamily N-acetyltransferase